MESVEEKSKEKSKFFDTVGIDYDLGHYPLFSVSKERKGGIKKIFLKDGYWEIRAPQFPNFNDLDVLLGVIKAFEKTAPDKISEVNINHISGKQISISGRSLCKFCGTHPNGNGLDLLEETLKLLRSVTLFKHSKNSEMQSYNLILDLSWRGEGEDSKKIKITLDSKFLEINLTRNYRIRHQEIQKQRGQVSKGLLFYLDCNNSRPTVWIPERRLMKFLGLIEPKGINNIKRYKELLHLYQKNVRDYRDDVKLSLNRFKVEKLIKNWSVKERNGVRMYIISKSNFMKLIKKETNHADN